MSAKFEPKQDNKLKRTSNNYYSEFNANYLLFYRMISILMPAKNAEPYLDDCLKSILNQSFTNWELIVVDDHSSDDTNSLLTAYAKSDPRIKVLKNRGNGIVDALALAEEKSSGEFITRMDADDLMDELKLETLLETLPNDQAISTSYVKYFAESELGEGYKNYEQWLNCLIDKDNHFDQIYKECVLPSPNWLMHKETLKKLGGFENLNYPEDYDLCFKAYSEGIEIVGAKQVLHYWRDYPGRTSRTHEHYQDNAFLPLKVAYFKALDLNLNKELLLWGAGTKGKKLAQLLINEDIDFNWITNNEKKLEAPIYDVNLQHAQEVDTVHSQMIIAVSGPEDQLEIKTQLSEMEHVEVFWFC